jgi:hypothetical protein
MARANFYTRRSFMNTPDNSETRDALLLAGGAALMVFGAGMLLASPVIRRTVLGIVTPMLPGHDGANGTLGGFFPDVERYLKLKAM